MKCRQNEQQAGKLIFLKITAVKKAFYDVMLNQDVQAEKLLVDSTAILKVLFMHYAIQNLPFFLKTAQKECVGDTKGKLNRPMHLCQCYHLG